MAKSVLIVEEDPERGYIEFRLILPLEHSEPAPRIAAMAQNAVDEYMEDRGYYSESDDPGPDDESSGGGDTDPGKSPGNLH